jgi:hypothetical protein
LLTHRNTITEWFKVRGRVLPEVMYANEPLEAGIIVDMMPNPTTKASRSKRKYQ